MPLSTSFRFVDNTTDLDEDEYNKLIDRTFTNMVKNSEMFSWFGGASAVPDAWILTGNGATIAREAATTLFGPYSAKISKATGDAGADTFKQDLFTAFKANGLASRNVTVTAWVRVTRASNVRLTINDGSDYYSAYVTTINQWVKVSVQHEMDATPTAFEIGVECDLDAVANYDVFVDGVSVVLGQTDLMIYKNPLDDALQCFLYENSGALAHCRGAVRIVPIYATGTTGANNYHVIAYTMQQACRQIFGVFINIEDLATSNEYDCFANVSNFNAAAGSFDINLRNVAAVFSTEAYTISGFAIVAGWDDGTEVHGD
jgi:hypothetical protein